MSFRPSNPSQGAPPPSYNVISRVYQKSLRPVVASITVISAVYAAIWAISAFQDVGGDTQTLSPLVKYNVILGILYVVIAALEAFGLASAWLERVRLVRLYAFASGLVVLIVSGAEILRIVVHFMFKGTITQSCINVVGSPDPNDCANGYCGGNALDLSDATSYCSSSFNRTSFSDIAWFLAATLISMLFCTIAFGYYRQLMSIGTRVAPSQIRMDSFPPSSSYDPPRYPPPGVAPPYVPAPENAYSGGDKAPGYEESYGLGIGADGKHSDIKSSFDKGGFEEEDVGYDMSDSPHHTGGGGSGSHGNGTNPFR